MQKIAMIAGILFIAACLGGGSMAFADMPGPDPQALWNYITKGFPYQNWSFWPDHQGIQPGRAPHGPLHKVYVNDRALHSAKPPVHHGSIIVKENYSKAKELVAITVMYKLPGYNPNAGDWFWVKYTPEGQAKPFGKPKGCIGCHGTKAKNDFIILHEFK